MIVPALVLLSCKKEPEGVVCGDNSDAISFTVNEARPYATKSAGNVSSQLHSESVFNTDSVNLYLNVNESDYQCDFFTEPVVESKGVPYTDNKIGQFYVIAFLSGMELFFNDLSLNSVNGESVSTGYYWPISTPPAKINFFAYAKNGTEGSINNHEYLSATSARFHYALPLLENNETAHAVKQPDMLFAIAPEQVKSGGSVQMNFYHALSALAFSVGSVPGNLKIESVSFTNVYSSGTCEYVHSNEGLTFNWSFKDGVDSKNDYTQSFSKELFQSGNEPLEEGTAINTGEQTFMMIPQIITDDTKIIIAISFEGRNYTITKQLNKMTSCWYPGKLYTFKISSPEEVQIEVTDEVVMDGIYPVKQNLQIKNIGIADAYVRVAIAGSWVVDDIKGDGSTTQLIISDWKSSDGEFMWPSQVPAVGSTNTNNWRLGSDGYYYYMKKVSTGETLSPLFTSYKLTAPSPMSGAYLELSILTQGVLSDDVEELFPVDIYPNLIK